MAQNQNVLNQNDESGNYIPCGKRGYEWKVVVDPTETNEESGLFLGGLFRMVDFRLDRDEKSTWPDGIVFENVYTGHRLTFQNGSLFDLTKAISMARKTRIPKKKEKPLTPDTNPSASPIQIRRFIMIRSKDLTGISGTGVVAEGAVFSDGLSILRWLRSPFALGVYPSLDDLITVHGHGGASQVVFMDECIQPE